jgi:hypothetical protein
MCGELQEHNWRLSQSLTRRKLGSSWKGNDSFSNTFIMQDAKGIGFQILTNDSGICEA